jgi:hypothetical protein
MSSQVKIEPIEEAVFSGLRRKIARVFGIRAVFLNSTDEVQAIQKLTEKGIQYPYMFLSLSSMAETKDTYRAIPLLRRGIDTILTNDEKQVFKVTVLPTDFVMEVTYKDQNFVRLRNFAKLWLMAGRGGYLKYSVRYGTTFDIHLVLSDDLSIPKREANPQDVQEYTLIANLTIRGYVSSSHLRDQQVANEVQVDAYLQELGKQENTQFMSFNRKQDSSTLE